MILILKLSVLLSLNSKSNAPINIIFFKNYTVTTYIYFMIIIHNAIIPNLKLGVTNDNKLIYIMNQYELF